jgi:crossover junction endodeoxyribonuclease RuvC
MFKAAGPTEIARARRLRRDATESEKRLWWTLRALKPLGYHFRRQSPFQNYTLDFVEHDAKLVVELDGEQHGEAAHREHDAKRDALLTSQGYLTLRFWNSEIAENIDGTTDRILRELQQRSPTRSASRIDLPTEGEVKKETRPLPRKGLRRLV